MTASRERIPTVRVDPILIGMDDSLFVAVRISLPAP